jgi:secreted PhoX family phosphatase
MNKKLVVCGVAAALASAAAIASPPDFGQKVEALARSQALRLFGVFGVLAGSSSTDLSLAQIDADPRSAVNVARGLSVRLVSGAANLGTSIDMMVLWPDDSAPTHIIACNEAGPADVGVQRIRLSDGLVENIISSGLTSCDPAEITPWGTVIVGEENGANGRVFEIMDPLHTTGVTVSGAGAGTTTSDPAHVAARPALGQLSFEGISVLPNGVVFYQDENRPSATDAGGGYFKFIPTSLWAGGAPITSLSQSPLGSGRIFGMRRGRNSGNADFGQANHSGRGVWAEIVDGQLVGSAALSRGNLRQASTALKLSAGYRPEDQDIDKGALARGEVRVCGTNTGQDTATTSANGDNNFGETFCISDGTIAASAVINTTTVVQGGITYTLNTGAGTSIPEYQILVQHFRDFGMPDNIAYQPGRGNWLIHEDGDGASYSPARNNDIWDCVDDGADADLLADACVKVISINDLQAETTGGVFNANGREFYFSLQHPDNASSANGHGLIYKVTGWR